jgi:hypothetical protein
MLHYITCIREYTYLLVLKLNTKLWPRALFHCASRELRIQRNTSREGIRTSGATFFSFRSTCITSDVVSTL